MIMKHLKHVLFAFAAALLTLGATDVAHAATEVEDNGTSAYANPMALNEVHTGLLDSKSDVDWYSFTTTEDGILQFLFAPLDESNVGSGWDIYIYDENLNELRSYETKSSFSSAYLPMKATKIYVKIVIASDYSWDRVGGDYALAMNFATGNWEAEYNDSYGTANAIKLDTTYSGAIWKLEDCDFYTFTTTKAGYYTVTFGPDPSVDMTSQDYGWSWEIYDSEYNKIFSRYNDKKSVTSFELPYKPGKYYIKVSSASSYSWDWPRNITYNLSVKHTPSKVWEQENNDSLSNASEMPLNKFVTGYLNSDSDVDWFKFKVASKSNVKVTFRMDENTNFDNIGDGWKVSIYESGNATPIWSESYVKAEKTFEKVLTKGTYYVKVENSYYYSAADWCKYNVKAAVAAIPAKPTGVTATAGTKKATIKWKTSKNATAYYVMRSETEDGKYTNIATVKDATSYTDSSVKSKKTYYYKVIAVNSKNGVNAKSAGSEIKSVKIK